jgi:transmembrane sensor
VQRGLTDEERFALEKWLHDDPHHAEIFAEMDVTSRLLDQLHDTSRMPERAASHEAASNLAFAPARSRRSAWRTPVSLLAAAAAIAIAVVTWGPQASSDSFAESIATEVGGLRDVPLPDGSVVRLNTDSAVEIHFAPSERGVQLTRGEAFFTVAKDQRRPFHVDTAGVSVRAVGTAFNVRRRAEMVEVLVKEGKVSVNPTLPPVATVPRTSGDHATGFDARLLVAGEMAVIGALADGGVRSAPITVAEFDAERIESALAWQSRRLEFVDTPLSEVVAEFNRYNRHQLTIVDPALARQTFGGAFASTGYASFVEVLEQSFRVVAEHREAETILRLAP